MTTCGWHPWDAGQFSLIPLAKLTGSTNCFSAFGIFKLRWVYWEVTPLEDEEHLDLVSLEIEFFLVGELTFKNNISMLEICEPCLGTL